MHELVAKEISDEIPLIEAGNEANDGLLASFPTKSSGISAIFTRHPSRARVSVYHEAHEGHEVKSKKYGIFLVFFRLFMGFMVKLVFKLSRTLDVKNTSF